MKPLTIITICFVMGVVFQHAAISNDSNTQDYKKITFEDIIKDGKKWDNQLIEIEGLYSEFREMGPLLFKTQEDLRAKKWKNGIPLSTLEGIFVDVKHNKPVVVRGRLRLYKDDEAKLYLAEINDISIIIGKQPTSREQPKKKEEQPKEKAQRP